MLQKFVFSSKSNPIVSKYSLQLIRKYTNSKEQVYGIATFDGLFEYILSDKDIRSSIFQTFIPDLKITSSTRVDDHINPLKEVEILRELLHHKETKNTISTVAKEVMLIEELTELITELLSRFDEIERAFPKRQNYGTMNFICKLENGEYAMLVMQVVPQHYWDDKALAYVAAFYGYQFKRGSEWSTLRRVIGITISECDKYEKHLCKGIELIRYSMLDAPTNLPTEKNDWITFFKRGQFMSEEEVDKTITTEAVKKAFQLVKIKQLPEVVKKAYDAQVYKYSKYSEHTNELVKEAKREGRAEGREEGRKREKLAIAKQLLANGIDREQVKQLLELKDTDLKFE